MATPLSQYLSGMNTPGTPAPFANQPNGQQTVQSSLEAFLNPNSSLMQQAALQGRNTAAQRGGINSSIAAGASQRSMIEQANNLSAQALSIDQQREQVLSQDWMANQNFTRSMASLPFTSSINMLQQITQYGLEDPQLYTPSVVSGFNDFFNRQMNDMIARYFT